MNKQVDYNEENTCWACHGTGEGMADGSQCSICRGKGYIISANNDYYDDEGDYPYEKR